jgi:hypothetical protein
MRSVFRSIAAVIAGFIAASIVMMSIESINGRILYPELAKAATGLTDREALRALLAAAPSGALLVVMVGWCLGGIAGGLSGRAPRACTLGWHFAGGSAARNPTHRFPTP